MGPFCLARGWQAEEYNGAREGSEAAGGLHRSCAESGRRAPLLCSSVSLWLHRALERDCLDTVMISGYHHDMPRKKISTVLDEHLFRRAKLESVRQHKQVSEILGEALERYLGTPGSHLTTGVAADSWGVLRVDRRTVARLLSDEEGLLDA